MLQYISKINGTKLPDDTLQQLQKLTKHIEKTYGFASLFSSWRLAKNTIIISISWYVPDEKMIPMYGNDNCVYMFHIRLSVVMQLLFVQVFGQICIAEFNGLCCSLGVEYKHDPTFIRRRIFVYYKTYMKK